MIVYDLKLDVAPVENRIEIRLNQGDTDYELRFQLFASIGTLDIQSGTTVAMRGTKINSTEAYSKTGTLSTVPDTNVPVVVIEGDSALTENAGNGMFELRLSHEGKYLHTSNFYVKVEKAPVIGA